MERNLPPQNLLGGAHCMNKDCSRFADENGQGYCLNCYTRNMDRMQQKPQHQQQQQQREREQQQQREREQQQWEAQKNQQEMQQQQEAFQRQQEQERLKQDQLRQEKEQARRNEEEAARRQQAEKMRQQQEWKQRQEHEQAQFRAPVASHTAPVVGELCNNKHCANVSAPACDGYCANCFAELKSPKNPATSVSTTVSQPKPKPRTNRVVKTSPKLLKSEEPIREIGQLTNQVTQQTNQAAYQNKCFACEKKLPASDTGYYCLCKTHAFAYAQILDIIPEETQGAPTDRPLNNNNNNHPGSQPLHPGSSEPTLRYSGGQPFSPGTDVPHQQRSREMRRLSEQQPPQGGGGMDPVGTYPAPMQGTSQAAFSQAQGTGAVNSQAAAMQSVGQAPFPATSQAAPLQGTGPVYSQAAPVLGPVQSSYPTNAHPGHGLPSPQSRDMYANQQMDVNNSYDYQPPLHAAQGGRGVYDGRSRDQQPPPSGTHGGTHDPGSVRRLSADQPGHYNNNHQEPIYGNQEPIYGNQEPLYGNQPGMGANQQRGDWKQPSTTGSGARDSMAGTSGQGTKPSITTHADQEASHHGQPMPGGKVLCKYPGCSFYSCKQYDGYCEDCYYEKSGLQKYKRCESANCSRYVPGNVRPYCDSCNRQRQQQGY